MSQTLRRWTEGATYVRQGNHHVGHWPTFLVHYAMLHPCGVLYGILFQPRYGPSKLNKLQRYNERPGINYYVYTSTNTTTVLRLLSGTTRVSQYQKKTFTHSTSWSSSNLYQLLPSTTIHSILPVQFTCLTILFHNLSPSSLVYLLVWSPPPHTPYISSPSQCLLFATRPYHRNLFCCSTKIMSLSQLFTWDFIFYLNVTHPSDHSHLFPLVTPRFLFWQAMYIQAKLQHNLLVTLNNNLGLIVSVKA